MVLCKLKMSNSNLPTANVRHKQQSSGIEKWEECYKSGVPMVVGGVVLGGCFSIVTFTPFPFLILSTIGIYSAVENCDNIFREAASKSATQQDK